MQSGFNEISMDILLPDSSGGNVPKSRLRDAGSIRTLYSNLVRSDEQSAIARARVDGIVDGLPPFNHAQLVATGQGGNANANFLIAQNRINRANAGFIDMVTSVRSLVRISCEWGEVSERHWINRVIETEITRTIRKWSAFTPRFQQTVNLFNKHGVGVTYFNDTSDFRFRVCGLGDFLIPRQTVASEDAIPYAVARWDALTTDLFDHIRDRGKAIAAGWNPDAVTAAISRAVTASANGNHDEIERLQSEIRNNDLRTNHVFEHVRLLVCWVREFGGGVSFYIVEKDAPDGEFLFRSQNRYASDEQAFTLFCYGIGNGTYHSIRGLGHLIYPQVQVYDRMMCKLIDAGVAATMTWATYESGKALEEATFQAVGPVMLISPGIELQQRAFPNVANTGMPVLAEMKQMIDSTSSRFNTEGGVYQNRLDSARGLDEASGQESGSVDLFYVSFDRLVREMTRRIINGPKSDPLVREFHQRCAKAGVTPEMLREVDHASTYAFRAIGAGNPAARTINYERLTALLPNLDEMGQKRAIYDIVTDQVGYQNADYYAHLPEEPEYSVESALAELENAALRNGDEVNVHPQQLHGTHARVHLPFIQRMIEGIEVGEIDPLENLPVLRASLAHLGAHGESLTRDPAQQMLAGVVREAVNNLGQIVDNMEKKLRAMEREGQAPGADGQQDTARRAEELKLAIAQYKFDLEQRKGDLEIATMQAKAQQALALNDARAAMQAQRQVAYPALGYEDRRRR